MIYIGSECKENINLYIDVYTGARSQIITYTQLKLPFIKMRLSKKEISILFVYSFTQKRDMTLSILLKWSL